jgi:uncharacterized protein (DUF2141 family)
MSVVRSMLFGGLFMSLICSLAQAKELSISVSGIDAFRSGNIMVMLYAREGYPKDHDKAIAIQTQSADSPNLEFRFTVDVDEFAVKVLHDENSDGKVTKNWTGVIPAEGLGFSNGAKLGVGPPSFKRSALKLSEIGDMIDIPIIYP